MKYIIIVLTLIVSGRAVAQKKNSYPSEKYPIVDVTTFELTVPNDYNHSTWLDSFMAYNKIGRYEDSNYITDKNFSNVTTKLQPGKTYLVKIFVVAGKSNFIFDYEKCMEFLKSQNAIFTGAQGLTLAWKLYPNEFWDGIYTVSLDEKNALFSDSSSYYFPYEASGEFGVSILGKENSFYFSRGQNILAFFEKH